MTVIVGMNNFNNIINKPISYLKDEEQSMDSCVITYEPFHKATRNRFGAFTFTYALKSVSIHF